MTPRDVIIERQNKESISQTELARKLELKQGTIATMLARDEGIKMRVETFVKILDALDCDLVVLPRYDMDEDIEYLIDCDSEEIDYKRFRRDREERFYRRHDKQNW